MAQSSKSKKEMPVTPVKCLWGHLCSLSSIDEERKNLSLFNIIEQFNFPQAAFDEHAKTQKIIVIPINHEIVLLWMRTLDIAGINDELSFDFSMKVVDPNNKVIQQTVATINFPKEIKRLRHRLQSNAIPITTPGNYRYDIEVKKEGKDEFEASYSIPLEIRAVNSNLLQ